jgi:hypothetical protein
MIEGWQWALIFKPLGLLLLFTPGALIVYMLRKHLPDCPLKRLLLISWKV